MSDNFTEPPWDVKCDYSYPRATHPIQIRKELEGKRYKHQLICYLPDRRSEPEKSENMKNAYLIAAAPEMYELLKEIYDRAYFEDSLISDYWERSIEDVLKKARGEK